MSPPAEVKPSPKVSPDAKVKPARKVSPPPQVPPRRKICYDCDQFVKDGTLAKVLFDGVCNLCAFSVRCIVERDPEARFFFAAL